MQSYENPIFQRGNTFGGFPRFTEPVPADERAPTAALGTSPGVFEIPPEFEDLKQLVAFNATVSFPTMPPPMPIPAIPQQFSYDGMWDSNGLGVSGYSMHAESTARSEDSGYHDAESCTAIPQGTLPATPQQLSYEGMRHSNGPLGVSDYSMLAESPARSEDSGYHDAGLCTALPQGTLPNACGQVFAPAMAVRATETTKSTSKPAPRQQQKAGSRISQGRIQKPQFDGRTARPEGLGVKDPASYNLSSWKDVNRRVGSLHQASRRKEQKMLMDYHKEKVDVLINFLLNLGTRACTEEEQKAVLDAYENGRGQERMNELAELKERIERKKAETKNKHNRTKSRKAPA
jgi:hypothetical protein